MADYIIPEGYKETSLGVIPKEWEIKRLGDICSYFKSGECITSKDISKKGEYPVYGGNGLRGYTNKKYTHDGAYILIGRQGALCGNINYVIGKCYISEHAIAVQTQNNLLWLRYKLDFWNLNRYSESSAQPGLSVEKLTRYKLALPPLEEQQKIAEVLSIWDKAIEKQTRLVEKLKLRKKGLMQQLLTGKKRLPGFSGEWKKVKFSSIIERMSNGYVYDTNNTGDIPITRIETISKGNIDYSKVGFIQYVGELEKYKLRKGDILFSHINSIAHIGKVAMFDGNKDLYHGMNLLLIRAKEIMNKNYLYYFLSSTIARRKVRSFAKQAVNQASVNTDEFKKWILCIPEIEEQNVIAHILAETDQEIKFAQEKLELLRQQKYGLMQQLLTGKKLIKF